MTKAAQIMELYARGGLSTREIANKVGCLPAYVRVCARQRKGGASEIDRRYQNSPHGKKSIARTQAKQRPAVLAYVRARAMTGDRDKASQAAKKLYRKLRQDGVAWREASLKSGHLYSRILQETGDKSAARKAYKARMSQQHELTP